jgi:hemolysin III
VGAPPALDSHKVTGKSRFPDEPARPEDSSVAGLGQSEVPSARKKFSILQFSVRTFVQFAVLLAAFRMLLPAFWSSQFAAGGLAILIVFLGTHLFLCFFEWGFHRYVLHSVISRWLQGFARGHRNHHGLTPIRLQPVRAGSDRYVFNRYPILEAAQFEDSAFPIYALATFWVLFTPLLIAVQLVLRDVPILMGGYAAITWSMCLYEILHAIEHQPYDWWKRATEHPRFGAVWRNLYGFHHMHHANISCNEAISGFFGLPIADWALGTYHQPKELLLEGRHASAKDFAVPAPPRIVHWLDGWARKRESRVRHQRG